MRCARRADRSAPSWGRKHDQEIVFTFGGTESDKSAILSALETQPGRNRIVTSAVEHPAVLSLATYLQQSRGVDVVVVGVDGNGRLDIDAYRAALTEQTVLTSIMWANNKTGVLYPVEELAALAHEVGALFHSDAVQAVGKVPIDLAASEIDMLSLSGHKLHEPKGIGALYVSKGDVSKGDVSKGVKLKPMVRGGRQAPGARPSGGNGKCVCDRRARCGSRNRPGPDG